MTSKKNAAGEDSRLQEKYQTIYQLLLKEYGRPEWRQHLPPVDELVSTILSQSTSDINRDKGFYALKDKYPDWESVMNAPENEVRDTIRPAGLANQKAPRIQAALRYIVAERGELSLDFLADMPLDGLEVGRDEKGAVAPYEAPNPYRGTIRHVRIELSE